MHPLLLSLIASAGLGAMIGLVRQWNEQAERPAGSDFAGVRTFTLWSLLGCIAAFVSQEYSALVLPVAMIVVGAHFVLGRWHTPASTPGGSTTVVASLLTILVGALVFWKQHQEAVLLSALMAVLIGFKDPIHAWTRAFTPTDMLATLKFVAITGVILPLVPDQAYGPFDAFNPRSIWMMVVLISGVGFIGYVMMRLLDARAGVLLSSLLGGIASSTATTLAFSRRSKEDAAHSENYAMAVAVACTVMLPRVLVILSFLSRELARTLILPFALMAVPGIGYVLWSGWRQRRRRKQSAQPAIGNPLSLMTAIKFAAIYAAIGFLVKAAAHFDRLNDGLLPLAFVSGLTDMDAIALSVADNLKQGAESLGLAARAIVVAAISNSLLKAGLAAAFGSKVLRWHVIGVMLVVVAGGIAGFLLIEVGGATPAGETPAAS